MEDILIPLFFFSSLVGIIYIFISTRNRERLALIEKGADAKIFNTGGDGFGRGVISLSLLAIGVGIGVLMGTIFEAMGLEEGLAYTSCIFIFGGFGLLISFFVNKKLNPKKD